MAHQSLFPSSPVRGFTIAITGSNVRSVHLFQNAYIIRQNTGEVTITSRTHNVSENITPYDTSSDDESFTYQGTVNAYIESSMGDESSESYSDLESVEITTNKATPHLSSSQIIL